MPEPLGITAMEQAVMRILPEDGTGIGNGRAMERLGWEEARYWKVRNSLEDKGLVKRGRGRGGSLRRVALEPSGVNTRNPASVSISTDDTPLVSVVEREIALYDPMAAVLRNEWAKDRRITPVGVETTALQGRRATGGTWSRPDLVSVEIKTYEYVPGKYLEIVTFEVKPSDAINVQAVYEALAHRRSGTRAYVVLHVPTDRETTLEDVIKDVCLVARSHGIGVVTVADPSDYSTWEEREEAHRYEPDPARVNDFIETQLSAALKNKIARGLR